MELQDQLYNKILNFHFSDYNPSWGTWALLSNNILSNPGTCGESEDLYGESSGDGATTGENVMNNTFGALTGVVQGVGGYFADVFTLGHAQGMRTAILGDVWELGEANAAAVKKFSRKYL